MVTRSQRPGRSGEPRLHLRPARALEIRVGTSATFGGRPLHEVIVERLREVYVATVAVEPGLVITVIDDDEGIDRALRHLGALTTHVVIAQSPIEVMAHA